MEKNTKPSHPIDIRLKVKIKIYDNYFKEKNITHTYVCTIMTPRGSAYNQIYYQNI